MPKRIAAEFAVWNPKSVQDQAQNLIPQILAIWNFANPSMV